MIVELDLRPFGDIHLTADITVDGEEYFVEGCLPGKAVYAGNVGMLLGDIERHFKSEGYKLDRWKLGVYGSIRGQFVHKEF